MKNIFLLIAFLLVLNFGFCQKLQIQDLITFSKQSTTSTIKKLSDLNYQEQNKNIHQGDTGRTYVHYTINSDSTITYRFIAVVSFKETEFSKFITYCSNDTLENSLLKKWLNANCIFSKNLNDYLYKSENNNIKISVQTIKLNNAKLGTISSTEYKIIPL